MSGALVKMKEMEKILNGEDLNLWVSILVTHLTMSFETRKKPNPINSSFSHQNQGELVRFVVVSNIKVTYINTYNFN